MTHIAIFNEQGPTDPQAYAKDTVVIRETARRFDAAWNAQDAKAIARLFREDGTACTSFKDQNAFGHEGLEEIFRNQLKAYPGWTWDTTVFVIRYVKPDLAVVSMESTAKPPAGNTTPPVVFNWLVTLMRDLRGPWSWQDAVLFKMMDWSDAHR